MSYLVDALKKAERERYTRQAQDIRDLSVSAGPEASISRAGPWLWLVAILVAANVALVIHVWRPGRTDALPAMATTLPLPIFDQLISKPSKSDGGAAQSRDEGGRSSSPSSSFSARLERSEVPDKRAISQPAANTGIDRSPATRPGPAQSPQSRGQITYAKTALVGGNANATGRESYSADNADTPDQSQLSGVPSVDINGQLYSSVPGRSFILVNGRRYHEGERLASGPAVESIGPNGATLRYHGQRYHVPGPG